MVKHTGGGAIYDQPQASVVGGMGLSVKSEWEANETGGMCR